MRGLLISLEKTFGHLAIPGLLRYVMVLQALVFVLSAIKPEQPLAEHLYFSAPLVAAGEWWRCVSFLFFPTGGGILWMLMSVCFMIWAGDCIEQAWGSFRLNLYLLASVLCVVVHGMVTGLGIATSFYILEGLVMAFALYVPEIEIMLMGLIPLRMKWIGWIAAGHVLFALLGVPYLRGHILASLLPFFVVFGPGFLALLKHRGAVMQRRQRFSSAQVAPGTALSSCVKCGKTDVSHPQLEFRVNAAGDDVCSDCRSVSQP